MEAHTEASAKQPWVGKLWAARSSVRCRRVPLLDVGGWRAGPFPRCAGGFQRPLRDAAPDRTRLDHHLVRRRPCDPPNASACGSARTDPGLPRRGVEPVQGRAPESRSALEAPTRSNAVSMSTDRPEPINPLSPPNGCCLLSIVCMRGCLSPPSIRSTHRPAPGGPTSRVTPPFVANPPCKPGGNQKIFSSDLKHLPEIFGGSTLRKSDGPPARL